MYAARKTMGDVTAQDLAISLLAPWWVNLLPNDPQSGVIPAPAVPPSLPSPSTLAADALAIQKQAIYLAIAVGAVGTLAAVAGVAYLVKGKGPRGRLR